MVYGTGGFQKVLTSVLLMKRLRIKFPEAELGLMESTARRFNNTHGYLDELTISSFKNHHVLLIAPAESALFVQSYLDEFSQFPQERIKQDLIKALRSLLEQEPYNLPAAHSLKFLDDLK